MYSVKSLRWRGTMSERKMEGDGFEEIIDSIANDVARLGSKSSIAD